MKLLVQIGTDYHLNHLPHFLVHYASIGVDTFVCGLQGNHRDRARALLAPYPHVIAADYGPVRFDAVSQPHWMAHFNDFRRAYAQPGEWCLFADVDEFHEYPVDFFAQLDREINAIRGRWVERLATHDGQLLPCLTKPGIGQQFPFATREIFCGISEKIMAVRADLDLFDGYHWVTGGTATPVYFPDYLNVHHFRWDDRAALKYKDRKWTSHYQITDGRVPDLRGVFAVDPPFPPSTTGRDQRDASARTRESAPTDAAPQPVIWLVGAGGSETSWLADLINDRHAYRLLVEPLHPSVWRFIAPDNPYLYLAPHTGTEYLPIFRQIFSGQLHDERVNQQRPVTTADDGLLIRDRFGHLCMNWVDQHFPQVKKVLLLRHPFAVALATMQSMEQGESGLADPRRFLDNPQLAALLRPFADIIQEVEGDFEHQMIVWAIIHYLTLVQLRGAQIHLVFYEELCANPEQELRRLLAYLGHPAAEEPLDARMLRYVPTPASTTDAWQRQLSAEQRDMGDYLLNVFGLGQIYNSQRLLPNRQAAAFLLRAASMASRPAPSPRAPVVALSTSSASDTEPCTLAYLIVAHHQPQHLGRLIRALDDVHSFFFIHIDAKVPLAPFQAAVPPQANIVFLPDRVDVQWGRLSVVQAMLKLIHRAVASSHAFRYYTVLSGSDYPIKPQQEIAARLHTSDRQFIRIERRLPGDQPHRVHNLPDGTYYGDLTAYHGSMYWSLTADCIQFILEFLDANPGYLDLHQYVFPPDEIFFHSLVKQSPFAAAIVHDFERTPHSDLLHHGNHYIDWAGRRPRDYLTLDERDFEDLLHSEALFARKFDEHTSRRLLDLLDTHVHGIRTPVVN